MLPPIPGVEEVVAWFGRWPSFHDAEILSVHLNRGAPSLIRIHTWNLSDKTDRQGHNIREREAIVVFEFRAIMELRMEGEDADEQNVVRGLDVEDADGGYRLRLFPCYGLSGELVVRQLSVRVEGGI
jgi:hypothetical protein